MATETIRAAVYGASGAAGAELVRILAAHPKAEVRYACSRNLAGERLASIEPGAPEVTLVEPRTNQLDDVDLVFSCLPHGNSAPLVEEGWRRHLPVIDLSGDLRLRDPDLHGHVYGSSRDSSLAAEAAYGLTELNRQEVRETRVVANPGCYPTCVGIALGPLAEAGLLNGLVNVDAKSGVSGAGRAATAVTHFCSAADDVRPYQVGVIHRHVAEMEQLLRDLSPPDALCPSPKVVFSPHLVPLVRGMLATILVTGLDVAGPALHELYTERYAGEAFVTLLPLGEPARVRAAARTNRAVIGISPIEDLGAAVITCAIDNLLKGAAGQAVQNMNAIFGWPETTGLDTLTA